MTLLDVVVQNDDGFANVPDDTDIVRWAEAAASAVPTLTRGEAPLELTVRVVNEDESRLLNHSYRSRDYATNVLSFSFEAPPGVTIPILGDLAICHPVILREATEQGKSPTAHWAHMVVHGTLHLLGFDHVDEVEADAMEALEVSILATIGFSDPYGDTSSP